MAEDELELAEVDVAVVLVMVVGGDDVLCDSCDFGSSFLSGSLGSLELPGVLGSFGSLPDPPPPASPPPPGGQKGHTHEGPSIPKPEVPGRHQVPPGPTMIGAAEMVKTLPSLFVSTLYASQLRSQSL